MRRLKREAEVLDLSLGKLGQTVDDVFNAENVAEVVTYERALASLDRQARSSFNSIGRNAKEAEFRTVGSIRRMDASVALFRENLDRLSKARATPKVDLDGVSQAMAQTALLDKRLDALSRRRVTPNVGLPASSLGGAFMGGGGGSTVSRSAFGGGGLKIPFAGSVPWPLVGGALAAAPPLAGATIATAGSLGSAALGAGALGIGAAGTGAAALGMTAPIAISSIAGIKEASKALAAYRQEVIQSGVNSEAARQKYRLYNMELHAAPAGTERLLRAKEGLVEDFRSSTRPAQAGFTGTLSRGLNLGRQLTPLYANQANRFFGEVRPQADQFADFLNNGSSRDFYRAMGSEATAALRPSEDIAENITGTLMNLSRAARPFFHEGLNFLDRWTGGWADSSKDIGSVRSDMDRWVTDLKEWGKLTGATFDLLKDLGSAGAGSGRSLVGDLTQQLEVWDDFVQNNPRQVRDFFHESVDSTEKLASAVGKISSLIWQISRELGPLLDQFSSLVSLAGNAGLLTPGGLPLLLAGYAGTRSLQSGLGNRLRGTAPAATGVGGVPMIIGGGGAAAERGLFAAAAARGGSFLSRSRLMGRVPIMSTTAASGLTMGMEAEAGMIGASRFSPMAAGRYAGGEMLGAARTGAATFGRGFAGKFGPYAALAAGLGAMSYQGNLHDRVQAGVSSATLGLVEMPKTRAEKFDEATRHAAMVSSYYGERYGGGATGLQEQIEATRRKRNRLLTPVAPGGVKGFEERPFGAGSIFGYDLGQANTTEVSDTSRTEAAALASHLQDLRNQRVSQVSQSAIGDITSAYGVRARHGAGDQENYQRTVEQIEGRVKRMHGRTAKQFGQMGLDWAQALAKANPKLKSAYEDLAKGVEQRMNEMGRNVAVIHGRLVDTSKRSWDRQVELAEQATQRELAVVNKNQTALEKRMELSLRRMGYGPQEAHALQQESFGNRGPINKVNANARHHGSPGLSPSAAGKATGGRLGVPANGSLHDEVYMGAGQWGAGGELVVNRHTERRINQMLAGSTTLGREVAGEHRAHSQMYRNATGGRITPAATLAERMGMGVSGGPGHGGIPSSGHATDSLHYAGLAYDVTGSSSQMRNYFLRAARTFRGSINELFYDPMGYYYDEGKRVPGAIGDHSDHVHIGFFPGGARLSGGMRGMGRAGRGANIHLRPDPSGLGGLPGAIADAASSSIANAASRNVNRLIGAHGGGGPIRGGGSAAQNKRLARSMLGNYGWGADQWNPLDQLWTQESGWRTTARNPSSGAYGIPQSLPASKMGAEAQGGGPAAAAAQIRWGLDYIRERYGSPAGAWSHEQSHNWYATGGRRRFGFAGWFANGGSGRVNGPTLLGIGEDGPEDFNITPAANKRSALRRSGDIHVAVNMGHVTLHGPGDAETVGKNIARTAARELTKVMKESDDVPEEALIGG